MRFRQEFDSKNISHTGARLAVGLDSLHPVCLLLHLKSSKWMHALAAKSFQTTNWGTGNGDIDGGDEGAGV
jgi:hypothetical protein